MRLRVDASDAGGVATRFDRARAGLPSEVRRSQRQIADGGVVIYRRHAPSASGRLGRGIRVVGGNTVRVDARNPETGYDYVGVTRKGHRKDKIVPKHPAKPGRYLAMIPGVGPRWVDKRAALRTPFGFRASVKGFRPASDWAVDARPQVKAKAKSEASGLSRRIGALFS